MNCRIPSWCQEKRRGKNLHDTIRSVRIVFSLGKEAFYIILSLCFSLSLLEKHSHLLYVLCSQFIYHNLIRHGPKSLDLDMKFITSPFMIGIVFEYIFEKIYKRYNRKFSGFPVVRTLHFHCRVPGWGQTNK